MESVLNPIGWLTVGAVLMLLELIIPGGIVFFLGSACIVVAMAVYLELVTTWVGALTLFFIASLILIVTLRALFSRFIEGDSSVGNTSEILDEVGEIVEVIESIGPADKVGTVKFRGTAWRALGGGKEIPAGSMARIVSRENISLLVTAVDPIEKQME